MKSLFLRFSGPHTERNQDIRVHTHMQAHSKGLSLVCNLSFWNPFSLPFYCQFNDVHCVFVSRNIPKSAHTLIRQALHTLSLSVYRVYRVSWNWKALLCSTEFLCQFDFVPHKHQFGLMCCCFTDGLLVIALYLPWFGFGWLWNCAIMWWLFYLVLSLAPTFIVFVSCETL